MDSTVNPSTPDDSDDLQVAVSTLEIDGTRPSVGDTVDLKVTGTISQLVNDTASVTPTAINDQPIPKEAMPPTDDDLMNAAGQQDASQGIGAY